MKKYLVILISLLTLAVSLSLVGCADGIAEKPMVVLSSKNISFNTLGAQQILTARSNGADESFVWETSNPEVATCEEGKITSVGYGVCMIKVTTGSGAAASCIVNVRDPNPYIELEKKEIVLSGEGSTFPLVVRNADGHVLTDGVNFYSSNRQVMVVENGCVIAKGPGISKLTAIYRNGARTECTVRVEGDSDTTVLIGETDIAFSAVGETYELPYTLTKEGKEDSVVWRSSDERVAVFEDGVVRATGYGACAIYASVDGGLPSSVYVTVGEPDNFVSIPDEKIDFELGNLGSVMYTVDRSTMKVKTMYVPLGYQVSGVYYDDDTIQLSVSLRCVKIYDSGEGEDTHMLYVGLDLYREKAEYCFSNYKKIKDTGIGDEFIIECSDFYVLIEPGLVRYLKLNGQLVTKR